MTTLDDRAEILAEIDGLTLPAALARTAAEHGGDPDYSDRRTADGTGWRTSTWGDVHRRARELGAAYVAAGVRPGDTVAIMASSRTEHVLADLGAVHAGATPMSVYATLAPEQVAYVAGHSTPVVVVLEGADQLERWSTALAERPEILRIVVMDEGAVPDDDRATGWAEFEASGSPADLAEVDRRIEGITADDPLTILYTSGTTGNPKGVVLTHGGILFEVVSSLRTGELEGTGTSISYLPFAHIAERVLGMYVPQYQGGHVHLIADPAQLAPALAEVRPTRFFGVPRVWEKIRTGVAAKLAAETDEARKAGIEKALEIGLAYVESTQVGRTTPPELQAQFEAMDAAVLTHLRAALGLDRVEWAASAAAPMPVDVAKFFAGLGLRIFDVYGMTETTGSATSNGPGSFRLGTVGRPLAGVEARIADDGEICVRGPITTPGYLGNPEATAELIDADGWIHTGDIGTLDDEGFLSVVDRKKEMIITSSGKNIAPSNIENYLKESPFIGHAMVIGEGRPYVVAVLTLDGEIAPLIAQKMGLEAGSLAELAQHPAVRAAVGQAVEAANARLSRPEQVKAFELLSQEWTAESEELTPTLKLKRRVVVSKYADVIDRLYG
ncbi:AMP-dependent synthetase/ligase [Aeromicrobium marinum]|nr:AMP-dependent synthetase/ligase [Aeromicrobium marinum]